LAKELEASVAEFIWSLDRGALRGEVLGPLKRAALDCLAAILSGRSEPVSLKVLKHVTQAAPDGQATIVGHAARATAEGAALVNGTMGHACDYDDVSTSMWGHATAPVLPAVLAIAELENLSGADFLVGFLAGIEVETKLGAAAAPVHYEAGWHPTGSIGVFGAAAGTAKALGLDRDATRAALGIAASRAAGIRENFGTMTKPLHVGFAARDGLEAALLARLGVTASRQALDGTYGFLNVLAAGHRAADDLPRRLGNPFDIVDPGLAFKLYPSCSDTHASVDVALALRERHEIDAAAIRRVRAGIAPMVASNLVYHRPKTAAESKFSLEFCLAAALLRGRLGLAEFAPGVVDDPPIQDLIARIEVYIDPTLVPDDGPRFCWPASVEIATESGQSFKAIEANARGHPDKPMSAAELEAKFCDCAAPVLDRAAMRRVIDMVGRLETVRSIRELTQELAPVGASPFAAARA
jgi:2-methylcitrate dehydratase PrpD